MSQRESGDTEEEMTYEAPIGLEGIQNLSAIAREAPHHSMVSIEFSAFMKGTDALSFDSDGALDSAR